ncbi:MAG TPA: transcription elongation factor GreA [Actinomycetota bacterium]|jgi:transcription elongation factor GreA|nr:transcription elongation factor GreA [Actinomycetota bacterium]
MSERRSRRNPGEEASAVLTPQAYERLTDELERLKTEGRSRMAERLQHARELGDIRENAEYDAAKNEQGLMEARIRELQRLLKDPDIAAAVIQTEAAAPGVLVVLRPLDEDDPDEETYLLAASKEERSPGARTVSITSPLGKALVGRKPGDRVSYDAPGGMFSYEVVRLESRG